MEIDKTTNKLADRNAPPEQSDKTFAGDVTESAFRRTRFKRLSAKEKTFTRVDFSYCVFDACYLRTCTFKACDFTGCRFVSTNLTGSRFRDCDFKYATFEKTTIDSTVLDHCSPAEQNLQQKFARSLRVNYQSLGDVDGVNKAIDLELRATSTYLKKAWLGSEKYYRDRFSGGRRAAMFFRWAGFWMLDFMWGHGESLWKLVRSIAILLVLIAFADALVLQQPSSAPAYLRSLANSFEYFIGTKSTSPFPGFCLAVIRLCRLISISLLTTVLVRRLVRR